MEKYPQGRIKQQVKMITFMLPIFYLPHKNPTLFTLLIPEDSRYPSKLGREDTRAKLQKQAKLCWWLRDALFQSSFRSLQFGA